MVALSLAPGRLLEAHIDEVAADLRNGRLVPFIGPGLSALGSPAAPMTPEALAEWLGAKVALPRRAKGNPWAAAQHIESYKHRSTVTTLMGEAFAQPVAPTAFHHYVAGLGLPMIVDSWYAGEMRAALAGREDWAEVQGITRAGIGEDRWYRFYGPDGAECSRDAAAAATTLLYTPHGSIAPARNFLISDADYVEVLTEIDIQTPIPDSVRDRRTTMGFLFIGCRFHDQMLRTYARQITKRAAGPFYAIVDAAGLTRNELRFLDEEGIAMVDMPLAEAVAALIHAKL